MPAGALSINSLDKSTYTVFPFRVQELTLVPSGIADSNFSLSGPAIKRFIR